MVNQPHPLDGIEAFEQGDPMVTVYVAATTKDSAYDFFRLEIEGEVEDEIRAIAQDEIANYHEMVIRPFEFSYNPEGTECLDLPLDDEPSVAAITDLIEAHTANVDTPVYASEQAVFNRIRFYVIVLTADDGENVILFRYKKPTSVITKKGTITLAIQNHVFNKVEDEKLLVFDTGIDCVAWNGHLFINGLTGFRRLFRFGETLAAQAKTTIGEIAAIIPIVNIGDLLSTLIIDSRMLAKLASIKRKPYLQGLTVDKIKQCADVYGIDLEWGTDGDGNEALVFDAAPLERWKILKIFDDDFLSSTMTELKYEVNSKATL